MLQDLCDGISWSVEAVKHFSLVLKIDSISVNMIGMNKAASLDSATEPTGFSRRRRVPSKYAESIRELTMVLVSSFQMGGKTSKRDKHYSSNDDESPLPYSADPARPSTLTCVLPRTCRKLHLSVIIKKAPKPKLAAKSSKALVVEKEKPKETPKGKSLLDTLLEACEQIKEDESGNKENSLRKSEEGEENQNVTYRWEMRVRREREEEEKYLKMYSRYQSLAARVEQSETEAVVI